VSEGLLIVATFANEVCPAFLRTPARRHGCAVRSRARPEDRDRKESRSTHETPEIVVVLELFRLAHGHGYATEAVEAIVAAAAEEGRARLWSTVRDWNRPSLQVLETLRFVQRPGPARRLNGLI
jgi:hypothetical protein